MAPLVLTAPQNMLARTAGELVSKHGGVDRQRRLRDEGADLGYSPEVWAEMADLGWLGIPFAEEHGGLGMGMAETVLITEAMGRGLAPEPFVSAVVFGGGLLADAGNVEQQAEWLPPLIDGEKRLAPALLETGSRYGLDRVETRARANGNGWTLSGEKVQVAGGVGADGFLIAAGTEGGDNGLTLFLVPASADGLEVVAQQRVDSRNSAIVRLNGVHVAAGDVLGEVGGGLEPLGRAVDRATVAVCGEMLGVMTEAFERTVEYLKSRSQFGVLIGTFQALKHRAATMFIEIELSRSTVMSAARVLDEDSDDAEVQVSNAKARCSDALILVTNEALQMHGGIGMTDEHDIGLFMKRARALEFAFGDAAFHRQRFARLRGF
ncbi:MAG: acyl-CoA dehydrogenase [Holophagales bacterium]|nr:acyl-CoA dehydrogenase [Holophagales bacterium]MYF95983.1 acyl-CoA dehydrogenase [Holophagales bacterium]